MKFTILSKSSLLFNSFCCLFFKFNNLKTRTAINAKISVFVICVEVIMYLLLYSFHDFTFNLKSIRMQFLPTEVRQLAFSYNVFAGTNNIFGLFRYS